MHKKLSINLSPAFTQLTSKTGNQFFKKGFESAFPCF